MRYIRYAFLLLLAIVLVTIALANRQIVSVHLLPEQLAGLTGLNNTLQLPLFLVIFLGIVIGLLVGFFWEWMRAHRVRAEAKQSKRELGRLTREVGRLKEGTSDQKDDVLALLEESGATR